MKYHFAALLIAMAASVATAFASAVVLAIVGIYLSGHSYTWHERDLDLLFFRGSPLSLIFAIATILAFAISYVIGLVVLQKIGEARHKTSGEDPN